MKGLLGGDGGGERGAALVEMAITITLLMMLLLGMVSAGITHDDNLALETAAREASRFGATYPVADAGTLEDWLRGVAQAAEDAAAGSVDPGVAGRVICAAQGFGPNSADFSRLRVTGNDSIGTAAEVPGWCFANTAPSEDVVVQVQVQRDGWIQAVLFELTPTLTGQSTNRFERVS